MSTISKNSLQSIYSTVQQGIQRASQEIAREAHNISQMGFNEKVDPLQSITNLKSEQRTVEALVRVLDTTRNLEDKVLDILA